MRLNSCSCSYSTKQQYRHGGCAEHRRRCTAYQKLSNARVAVGPHDEKINSLLRLISVQSCFHFSMQDLGVDDKASSKERAPRFLQRLSVAFRVSTNHNEMNW